MSNAPESLSDVLRAAVVASGLAYKALERETGVPRASIMRFVRGDQSLRLDKAEKIAAFLGLVLIRSIERK